MTERDWMGELERSIVRAAWIAAVKLRADDVAALEPDGFAERVHGVWLNEPPVEIDGRIDLEPFLRAVAREFDLDGDGLVAACQALELKAQAERAAAVEAAEELLRGEQ